MDFAYGRLFEMNKYKPFDFFRFNMLINYAGEQPPIGQFRIYAMLHGDNSTVGDNSKFLWGIFNHFDYLENSVYQLGGTSIGPGIGYRTPHNKSVQFIGIDARRPAAYGRREFRLFGRLQDCSFLILPGPII